MKQRRPLPIHDFATQQSQASSTMHVPSSRGNQEMIEQMQSRYTVLSGDSLWKISAMILGDGNRYMEIAELNGLSDPNQISVGQSLLLPTQYTHNQSNNDTNKTPTAVVKDLPPIDREKTLEFLDPLLNSMLRQDHKRGQDILSKRIDSAAPVSTENEPKRHLLMEAVQQYASDHPQRDGESWSGWCASLMFRFGKSTSGFRDGMNDASSAIKAAGVSNIESTDSSQAPKGAFHWWDIGKHGHVGLDVNGGGTQVFMATRKLEEFFGPTSNAIGLTSIAVYNQAISNGRYLGWSMDYVGATIQEELLKEAPDSARKPTT